MSDPTSNSSEPCEEMPSVEASNGAADTVGTRLSKEREARGWTIEQVASQLNLAPRQIQALEQDNHAALPGIAIVRGFIRAYAKLLKIDPASVIALLPTESVQAVETYRARPSLATPFSHGASLPSMSNGAPMSKSVLAMIVLAVVAALAFAAFQLGWVSPASLSFSLPSLPAGLSSEAVSGSGSNATSQQQPQASGSTATPVAAESPEPPADGAPAFAAAPEVPDAAVPAAVAPATGNALVLTAHQDSWIEARRAGKDGQATQQGGGNILASRLLKAGETETIDVPGPIVLTIGNVDGMEATLRGTALDLKAGAKNNVARINVK